jgi:hypothetical protein
MALNQRTLGPGSGDFNPKSISGLSLWLDGSDTRSLYTTDAGPVTPVSSPLDIAGCAGWWDGSDTSSMYTTDAGPVVPVTQPTDIAGCVGWWDASEASTLFAADTGDTLATTTVGRWANRGTLGSAADLLQATSGSRPETGVNTRNGRNVLSFDGSSDFMQRAFTLAQPCTVFLVFSYSSAYSATSTLIDGAGNGNTFRFATISNTSSIFVTGAGTPQFNLTNWGALNTWQQASFVGSGAASASLARRDGLTSIGGSGATATTTQPNGLTIASWGAFGLQYAHAQYAEVIAFDSALSAANIARVESYLASKWAISGVHRSAAQEIAAVATPTEIGGCLCWYDAADANSITKEVSTNLVSQWNDKSGNNRHATTSGSLRPTSGGSQNGKTVMQFTGTQAMTITGNFLQSDNVTMFAVAMKNTDHYGGIISSAPTNPEDSPLLCFYSTTLAFVNRRQVVQKAVGNSVYQIIAAQSAGTSQQGWFDGRRVTDSVASIATNTTNTITKIGAFRTSSTADLNGNIAEIICYAGNLSDTDRARVEKYLAAKWGIANVPDPTPPVGYWANRGTLGSAADLLQATSGSRPAITANALNAKPVLTFDGTADFLRTGAITLNQPFQYYMVFRFDSAYTSGAPRVIDAGNPAVARSGEVYRNDANTIWLFSGSGHVGPTVGSSLIQSYNIWNFSFDGTSSYVRYKAGDFQSTASTSGTNNASRLTVGADLNTTASSFSNISVAEIVVFNTALSIADRARVEAYLATKWGIPDVHKNSSAMTLPVQSPAELPGLDSWWDFSDPSTVTVDASQQVTSVAAKVGTNATLTPSFAGFFASYGDYINGRKAIFFGEGEYRRQLKTGLGVADPNTPLTVFMAFAPERNASVPVGNQALMSKGYSGDNRRFSLGYYPQTQGAPYTNAVRLIYFQAGTSYDTGSTVSASASGCNILVFSAQPGDVRLWGDRTSTYSSTAASSYGTTESTAGFSVGGNPEGGATRGAIGEVIIFRRILSDNERQRVEHYLRLKWRGDSDLQPTPPVGAWMDKSGKERHVTQATQATMPVMGTQNGRKALTFDGSNDNLRHTPSTAIGSTELTIIAAIKHNLTSQPYYLSQPLSLTGAGAGRPLERWQGGASESVVLISNGTTNVGGSYRQQPDRFVYSIDAAKDFISSGTHQVREFLNGATNFDVSNTGAWSTFSQRINVGARDDGATQYKGDICEVFAYDRRLSTAERQRAQRYLAARWGISLAPQVSNLDAQDWVNRVYQSGGTCSESTAKAVSTFCDAIDAANIRDRFYRLNLFCGGSSGTSAGLASCLTPLYRTPNKTVRNLFQHGTDMSNAAWLGGGNGPMTRTVSTEVGPLGYGYATKLITPTTGGGFAIRQMYQLLPTQNRQVTLSVWLKTNTSTKDIQWLINGEYLDTFTVTSTWTRYTKTYTSTISANDGRTALVSVSELNDAGHILAWGMQCEYGSAATDYTQPVYGNATDTNVGAFVASDYNETGAGGGLAAGAGKYLNTGLPQYVSPAAGSHLSVYEPTKPLTQSYGNRIGVRDTNTTDEHVLTNGVDTRVVYASGAVAGNGRTGTGPYGEIGAFLLGVSTSATSAVMYKNGLASGFAGTPTLRTPSVKSYYVFALNSNNAVDSGMTSGRLASYSVGLGFDATEAAKYNDAMLAFQRALGRDRPTNDPAFAAVTNEDARLWIDTVYANFGSVSVSTANAVNTFCNAIESANVRDRFYRLNLFCGGTNATTAGLNSCLTPLFKNWKSCSGRNLQKYGDVLTASAWTKSNSTASVSASERPFPYGPYANVLTANAGTGITPYVVSTSDNFGYGTITVSAYLKAAGVTSARILLSASSGLVFTGSATSAYATVNLTTGAVSSLGAVDTATATSVGNGWWRFAVTATTINGGAGNMAIRIDLGTGNPYSPVGTESLLVWGVQAEEGSVATAYDPYPLGNVVDANAGGLFLGADYADTGTSGGLKGNGSNKCLRHGILMTSFPDINSAHLSAYQITAGNGLSSLSVYWQNSADSSQSRLWEIIGSAGYVGNANSFSAPIGGRPALITLSRESQSVAYGYLDSSQSAPHTVPGQSVVPAETVVFARNLLTGTPPVAGFVPALHSSARLGGYSLGAGMTSSQVSAYSSAMQTFQRSLGRDRPSSDPMFASVTNEDAKLWIDNVYNNSGTVNSRTANAVNAFCNAIDAANIRDRFYRLNLFCGGESGTAAGLNACLTPLYRGPTRTGAQFGNAVDNNIGGASSFLSADYAETSGLRAANGTTKYLDTGLAPSAMPQSVYESMHLSAWHGPVDGIVTDPMLIGSVDSTNLERYWIQISIRATAAYDNVRLGRATLALSATPVIGARVPAFLLGTRRDATSLKFFRNGVPDGETLTSTTPLSANPYSFYVFRNNTNGSPAGDMGGANIRSYSIGDDMSDIQVAAFYAAQKAFQYAILRAL